MFSLIISLVAIALVVVLAVATMWYGGDAFTKNKVKSNVATVMAAGNQISGAVEAYKANYGSAPTTLDELVSKKLLNNVPQGSWQFANDYIVQGAVSQAECTEANRQLGFIGVPDCADPTVTGVTACCSTN